MPENKKLEMQAAQALAALMELHGITQMDLVNFHQGNFYYVSKEFPNGRVVEKVKRNA